MAKHRIQAAIPKIEITNTDIEVKVWRDETLLGELKTSKGSVDWRPAYSQYHYSMDWAKFDNMMKEQGIQTGKK